MLQSYAGSIDAGLRRTMADEALKCFTSLLESIPGWIADLEDTLQTATKRQKEMLFENQPPQDEQPVDSCHDPPHQPSKSSSIRSKLDIDETDDAVQHDIENGPVAMQRPHMTQSDALRLAQRKRKTTSVYSGREGGVHKYRSRSMVVVYYDGDTQKRFEGIVRAIGTCRNALRKGKMSAKVELLSQKGPSRDVENSDNDDPIEIPRMMLRSTRSKKGPTASTSNDESLAFDQIDGSLEKAQTMCERAAHQILRDGDCAPEMKEAQKHFIHARTLGEGEVLTWQRRAEEAAKRTKRSEEREAAREVVAETAELTSSSQEGLLTSNEASISPTTLEVDIEVDDTSDGDDEPSIGPLGHTFPQGLYARGSSLTVH